MSENVIQTSFAAGELAPSIFARTDLATYHQGLANCRNFFVDYRSGISTRQGSKFIMPSTQPGSRLIPFSVSTTVTYGIEFGNGYCRFVNQGAPVLEPQLPITAVATGITTQITISGATYNIGDLVFLESVPGIPALNNRYVVINAFPGGPSVYTVVDPQTFNQINSSTWGSLTSNGTAARVYTIPSPYAAADLYPNPVTGNPGLKFAQSVSVIYLTHPNYPPTTLTFVSPTNWFFTILAFGATIPAPFNAWLSALQVPNPGAAAGVPPIIANYVYAVTAVDNLGQESVPTYVPEFNAGNTGPGSTSVISQTAMTIGISWDNVTNAVSYNIYRTQFTVGTIDANGNLTTPNIPPNAMLGFLGAVAQTATFGTFMDTGFTPDFSTTPPLSQQNPFANGNNPGSVSFFQQRVYYAGSTSLPSTFWASVVGAFQNFNQSNPIQPSDTITGTIVSNQLNQIKHMVPMPGGLIFLTGRAAFTLTTGQGANATLAVTPINATLMPQAYTGCSDVQPIVINEDIIYVQAKGSIVRDLSYNIYAAIYTGTDISIRSNHLFFTHNILQWAYAEEPFKIVWCIREDGIMLSLTFMKEQQIYGWARHDTQGVFQSVIAIQEGQVDAPYIIVQRRTPDGIAFNSIERLMERTLTYGAEDAWSVDCGLRSTPSFPAANLTISGFSGTVTITASQAVFSPSSVGQVIRAGGGIMTVTGYSSNNMVTANITQTITQNTPDNTPPAISNTPPLFLSGNWSIATPQTQFFGLDFLAGQTINVNADGGVVNNIVVGPDGSFTIPNPASKVTAGLGFICQAQTMPLDVGEPTVQGKRKRIAAMNFKLASTRGLQVGRTLQTLTPMKDLTNQVSLGTQIPLISGDGRLVIGALYDVSGQVWMQVSDPLPATILGVIPEVVIGDTK